MLTEALEGLWLDRDLTWLEFNRRVLAEALDERNPMLERLKFLAIFTSNLDEFFMKRIAAPMVGGICTSFILELMVYPAIYATWKERQLSRTVRAATVWAPGSLESDHVELLEVR